MISTVDEEYAALEGLLVCEGYQVYKHPYHRAIYSLGTRSTITTEYCLIASKDSFSAAVFYNSGGKVLSNYTIGITSRAGIPYKFINGVQSTEGLLLELEKAAQLIGYCGNCYYCDDHASYCGLGLDLDEKCSSWEGV